MQSNVRMRTSTTETTAGRAQTPTINPKHSSAAGPIGVNVEMDESSNEAGDDVGDKDKDLEGKEVA